MEIAWHFDEIVNLGLFDRITVWPPLVSLRGYLMSQQSIHSPAPWAPEEDAILISCWADPDIDYAAIAKLLTGHRTAGAVLHRGMKIGLGQKARRKKSKKEANQRMAWPDDMPNFEDHPLAAPSGSLAKATRLGSRITAYGRAAEFSGTGSSLDGASINSTGRRI
jgi:hypothetical protein